MGCGCIFIYLIYWGVKALKVRVPRGLRRSGKGPAPEWKRSEGPTREGIRAPL